MKRAIGILGATLAVLVGGLSAARTRSDPAASACVESNDGRFCLCKEDAEVCAGEHAVKACAPRIDRVCCVSPAGFCYCGEDSRCTEDGDREVLRCGP